MVIDILDKHVFLLMLILQKFVNKPYETYVNMITIQLVLVYVRFHD
jgi:hypothetical protein